MILWRDLALFARFEREKNRVNLVCPAHQYFRRSILWHVFADGIKNKEFLHYGSDVAM